MTEEDRAPLCRAVADRQSEPLSIRQWQRVNRMLDDPAAWDAEPGALLILRRRRDARSRLRRS